MKLDWLFGALALVGWVLFAPVRWWQRLSRHLAWDSLLLVLLLAASAAWLGWAIVQWAVAQ